MSSRPAQFFLNQLFPPVTEPESPEVELLFLCAQASLSSQEIARLVALARQSLAWDFFVEQALYHKIYPLVYHNLRTYAGSITPPSVLDDLLPLFMKNSAANWRTEREVQRLLQHLQEQGIKVLLLKGLVLTQMLYQTSDLREFKDIDLLVPAAQIEAARTVLQELHYNALPATETGINHESFMDSTRNFEIELHWTIGISYMPFDLDSEDYWASATQVALNGFSAHTLSREDMLLMLCMHGARHRWHRLKWLVDISEFVKQSPTFDWDHALARAEALHMKRILLLNMWLIESLFQVTIPPVFCAHIEADKLLPFLGHYIRRWIFDQNNEGIWAQVKIATYVLLLRESWRYRLPYIISSVTHRRSREGKLFFLFLLLLLLLGGCGMLFLYKTIVLR